MTDLAASKAPVPTLTIRDHEILIAAMKCLKGDIQVDYAKLAIEGGFKDSKSANSGWLAVKKKLLAGGVPPTATSEGAGNKVKKTATPRKKKTLSESTTPKSLESPVKKEANKDFKAEEGEDDASGDENVGAASSNVKTDSKESAESDTEAELKAEPDHESVRGADGDSPMTEAPAADKGIGKAASTSVADNMSAGSMSPPPTPTPGKTKKVAAPGAKSTPKPSTGTDVSVKASPETPSSATPTAKKRGRKSKAEKEAEAAAAAAEKGGVEIEEEESEEQPAKKARKTPVKKAKQDEGISTASPATPKGAAKEEGEGKTPKKSSKPTKKQEAAAAKAAAGTALEEAQKAAQYKAEEKETEVKTAKAKNEAGAILANEVLAGKRITTKNDISTGASNLPNWGTPVNGSRSKSTQKEKELVEVAAAADGELAAGNTNVGGDTITVATPGRGHLT